MPEPTRLRMRIGGEWRTGATESKVVDPYRGETVSRATRSAT